jgi:hypothetical protein
VTAQFSSTVAVTSNWPVAVPAAQAGAASIVRTAIREIRISPSAFATFACIIITNNLLKG